MSTSKLEAQCQYPDCGNGRPNPASYFIQVPDSYVKPTTYEMIFYCASCVLNYPAGFVGTVFMPIALLAAPEMKAELAPLSTKAEDGDFDWPTEIEDIG